MSGPKFHEVDLWNRALSRVGDGRIVLEPDLVNTGVTATAPPLVTHGAFTFTNGDLVLLRDQIGGAEFDGRVFLLEVDTPGSTFTLVREDGTSYQASSGGSVARLPGTLKAVKACMDAWPRVRAEVFRAHPWNSIVKRARLARLQAARTIIAVTQANPAVVTTSAPHGFVAGDLVLIEALLGMSELNGRYFTVGTVPLTTTFQLAGENSTLHTAYSSGGTAKKALIPLAPDTGYSYRYTMPTDCLRVLEFVDDPDFQWETEGREVLTDAGITVPIRYCSLALDPALWDSGLVNVMVSRLAAEIVEELTQSTDKRRLALAEYDRMISEARSKDAQEQSPQELAEDDWIQARL